MRKDFLDETYSQMDQRLAGMFEWYVLQDPDHSLLKVEIWGIKKEGKRNVG